MILGWIVGAITIPAGLIAGLFWARELGKRSGS